jgi:hypothetical protein
VNVVPIIQPKADRFDEFWDSYPKRVGKPIARAKWNAITGEGLKTRTLDKDSNSYIEIELRATPEELIAGAKRYYQRNRRPGTAQFGFKDDGKFLCHPATWLNQGRWMDD